MAEQPARHRGGALSRAARPEKGKLSSGDPRSYWRLIRENRQYRRFWISGVISQGGDWFNYIGLFVLLNHLSGSGEVVSWFLIAKFLPTALLAPVTGVVADRFSKKAILIGCDLARMLLVPCYLLAGSGGHVYLILLLALIQESIWSFWHPARQALLPDICSREEINVANGLSGASWSVMLALGAAAGGFVSAVFGWQTAIVIDSLSFLVSALVMATVVVRAGSRRNGLGSQPRLTGFSDLMEGIRYVRQHRDIGALLMVKSGWAMSGGILVMLTVFGEQVFASKGQGGLSGVLYSMRGLGAAVGPMLAWRLLGDSSAAMRRAIGAAFFISSLAYMGFSQAPDIVLAGLCVFVGHIGGSIQWVFSTSLLHRQVDVRFRGRVFAAEMALLTVVMSLSTWLSGLALDWGVSPRVVVFVLALIFLIPGTLWSFISRNRSD